MPEEESGFYDKLIRDLVKVNLRRGLDMDQAQDLAQESVTKILEDRRRHPGKYQTDEHIRQASFVTDRNDLITKKNRAAMQKRRSASPETYHKESLSHGRTQHGVENETIWRETQSTLWSRILSLPQKAREALITLAATGDQDEAAKALNIKPSTFRTRVHKARKKLDNWEK